MKHRDLGFALLESLVGESEVAVVTIEVREQVLAHPLLLQAQRHHSIHIR